MKQLRGCPLGRVGCVLTAMLVVAACGDDDVDIREGGASDMLADSAVLAQMRSVDTVGRIIYEPAPDLSLASARQRRPDIFRPPAAAAARPGQGGATKVDSAGRARTP